MMGQSIGRRLIVGALLGVGALAVSAPTVAVRAFEVPASISQTSSRNVSVVDLEADAYLHGLRQFTGSGWRVQPGNVSLQAITGRADTMKVVSPEFGEAGVLGIQDPDGGDAYVARLRAVASSGFRRQAGYVPTASLVR